MAKTVLGLTESIATVVGLSCKFWNAQDYRGLHDLWDANEAEPWYVADDLDAPLAGWAALEAYWQSSLGLAERDELKFSDLQTKPLGTDLALAIYTLKYLRKVAGPQQTPESESRVTAIFRKQNKTWCFCHLVESPLSSVLSLRRSFESAAAPPAGRPKKR